MDLYSGYNDYNPIFDTEDLDNDESLQETLRTWDGRRQMTSQCSTTASEGWPVTSHLSDEEARPMTVFRSASYTSSTARGSTFGPLGQSRGPTPPLEPESEDLPENKVQILRKRVTDLIAESIEAQNAGNVKLALCKAKAAGRTQIEGNKTLENSDDEDPIISGLTFSVWFNLGNQYANNEMYLEALRSYRVIMKHDKGMVTAQMGNVQVKREKHRQAIKFYKMALDQYSNDKGMRIKIMRLIGQVYILMGLYPEAITYLELIMSESPDIQIAYNLTLCYYAIKDGEKMKECFEKLVSVPLGIDENKCTACNDDASSDLYVEAVKNDSLHQMEKDLEARAEKYIMTAAKLIAPAIETSTFAGLDWCADVLKSSAYFELAIVLELQKVKAFIRQWDAKQAVKLLKTLEEMDERVARDAANDLCFVYFLEEDYDKAEKYTDLAINANPYNPTAFTNKGNIMFVREDYENAAEFYKEALKNDPSFFDALHNLGLTYKRLNRLDEALDCFLKLYDILSSEDRTVYQLADIYHLMGDHQRAIECLLKILAVSPINGFIMAKLAQIYDDKGDKAQALHHYSESYRYLPSNMDTILWLGSYYWEAQLYEKTIHLFKKALHAYPEDVTLHLLVAVSYRRSGDLEKAMKTFGDTQLKLPESGELLLCLLKKSSVMGPKELHEFADKLEKGESVQSLNSGRQGSAGGQGGGTESSPWNAGSCPRRSSSPEGEQRSTRTRLLPGSHQPHRVNSPKELDASYADPLGPQLERPRTVAGRREEVKFSDEELREMWP